MLLATRNDNCLTHLVHRQLCSRAISLDHVELLRRDGLEELANVCVRASTDASWQALKTPHALGPIDQTNSPLIPVVTTVVWEASSRIGELLPFDRLETALGRLLDYYPHLTGRLTIDSDGRASIDRLGSGAELGQARASSRLSDCPGSGSGGRLVLPDLPQAGNFTLSPWKSTIEAVCQGPLVSFQHTRFACGSVGLGVRLLHIAADASTTYQILRDLVEILNALGDGRSALEVKLPDLQIESFMSELSKEDMSDHERRAALAQTPALFQHSPPPELVRPTASDEIPRPHIGRILLYTREELAMLKTLATPPDGSGWVSTFSALAAHLYQCIFRARVSLWAHEGRKGPPSSTLHVPVNVRSRLGLPERYAANAPLGTTLILPPEELHKAPLWKVASSVHGLSRQSAVSERNEIEAALRWAVAAGPAAAKMHFELGDGPLLVTAWQGFGAYPHLCLDGVRPSIVSQPLSPYLPDGIAFLGSTPQGETGFPLCRLERIAS
jgi:hypothetical protein